MIFGIFGLAGIWRAYWQMTYVYFKSALHSISIFLAVSLGVKLEFIARDDSAK